MKNLFSFSILFLGFFLVTLAQGDAQTDICPLLVGSTLPEVEITSAEGEAISLRMLTADQPSILIFYRGSWCPYCSRHFKAIGKIEQELKDMGYTILAISPDKPENVMGTMEKMEMGYSVYSDSDMKAADAFGLGFTVDDETVTRYKKYDIDLGAASGRTHGRLPVPAVFVVNKEGRIQFSYANPDYRERLSGEVLLAAAKAAL